MAGLTVKEVLSSIAPALATARTCPPWPPDAFALAAAVLQRSGAYSEVVSKWPPRKNWTPWIEGIGKKWRTAAGRNQKVPVQIQRWWDVIRASSEVAIEKVDEHEELTTALIQMVAAADTACAGIGFPMDLANDAFEARWLPLLGKNTFCEKVESIRAVVLPKLHTPRNGITIRSMTHHVALYLTGEVEPQWHWAVEEKEDWSVRLLIIPWPRVVEPTHLHPTVGELDNMPDHYGFFTYEGPERDAAAMDEVEALVAHARGIVGSIDGVVFPELALLPEEARRIAQKNETFVVAGVGTPARDHHPGTNEAVVEFAEPWYGSFEQPKHHRWRVDGSQINQYGIGASLDPTRSWWEHIDIPRRQLAFFSMRGWFTFSVLICEDLARLDPVTELLRAVGPNLVISLLMDGPQLSSRWPARYATVLADDPGSSVLTVTSIGMATACKPPGKKESRVIALWKDARSGGPVEIELDPTAGAVALTLTREYCEEWTADGRSDGGATAYLLLNGIHQIPKR